VTLQDERGDLSAIALGYLLTAPGFQALDAVPPRRVPQDGRLSTLEASEQERVRWLEGHLIELETGRHPERPPRAECDAVLHDTKKREQAKLAEFEAAGRPMTRRHLQRLRRAYREVGHQLTAAMRPFVRQRLCVDTAERFGVSSRAQWQWPQLSSRLLGAWLPGWPCPVPALPEPPDLGF
jgi:hypothetical protein